MIQEKDKRAFQGMSDADFFKSPHLVRLLCAVLVNVTKKKMRVTIESHTKALAYTNGSNVTINPEHPLLRPFPREDRVAILIGLVGHEGAHICLSELPLYSDFRNALKKFRFLFGEPDVPGFYQPFLVEIQEYMDRESTALRNTMLSFTQDVFNTIEDGYIERWLYREYPGNIKRGLREINQAIYDSLEPVEKIERQHPIQAIQNGLLSYILLGTVKGKSALYPDLIRAMVEEMQKAFGFSTAKERMQLSLAFFVMCWPIIKPQIDKAEQEKENIAEGLTGPKVPANLLCRISVGQNWTTPKRIPLTAVWIPCSPFGLLWAKYRWIFQSSALPARSEGNLHRFQIRRAGVRKSILRRYPLKQNKLSKKSGRKQPYGQENWPLRPPAS